MNTPVTIAIIGGGASGLMAAIHAALQGATVTVFERQDRIGKKILVTGNGRCNLTNTSVASHHYLSAQPDFVEKILKQYNVGQTLDFFHEIGVCTRVEEEGKIFPRTGQAANVLDALRFEAQRCGVVVRTGCEVQSVLPAHGGFRVCLTQGDEAADRVVVACGGKASGHLCGTPLGLRILEQLGHACLPTFPALVPCTTALPFNRRLKGLKVDAAAILEIDGKQQDACTDELLFTDYGLSGPSIIRFSLAAADALHRGGRCAVLIDLMPEWRAADLQEEIRRRCVRLPQAPVDQALIGLMHKRLIPVALQEAGCGDASMACENVTDAVQKAVVRFLKGWRIALTGTLSWQDAHVMAGGIDTRDFDPQTLVSKRVPGVYACGEVLDVTGECGGYNLQWAWSSGRVAGMASASA